MTTPDRSHLLLGVSLDGAGAHPAAWREPGADAAALFTGGHIVDLAQTAERGGLDFVTLGDSFALQPGGGGKVRGRLDALLALARVAPVTSSIGLVPVVTTTHTEPFHVSKNLATLDLVSGGRAGWLVEVSRSEGEARQFGRKQVADESDLYAEAAEAVDVVERLWDSWEDDAVIRDVPTGRYLDRDKVHYVDFEGQFFSVRGPSITPRSPQGRSIVVVHADSDHALALAAAWADIVLIDASTATDARQRRARVVAAVGAAGRDPDAVAVLANIGVLLDDTAASAHATRALLDQLAPAVPAALDFVGTAPGLVALLAEWAATAGVDGFHIAPALLPRTLQQITGDVLPLLRAESLVADSPPDAGRTFRDRLGLSRPTNRYAETGSR